MNRYKVGDKIEIFDVFGRSQLKAKLVDPNDHTQMPVKDNQGYRTYNILDADGSEALNVADYTHWISRNDEAHVLVKVPTDMIYVWQDRMDLLPSAANATNDQLQKEAIAQFIIKNPEFDRNDVDVRCEFIRNYGTALVIIRVFANANFPYEEARGAF